MLEKKINNTESMFADYPDIVGIRQLMEMLQIGQVLAYKLIKNGDIKSRKVGREYKIPKQNIVEYILKETEKR